MTETTIAEFFAYLSSLDVQVSVDDGRLRCTAPEGILTPELRQELVDRKAQLISFLHHRRSRSELSPTIQPSSGAVFPLSFAQQRLWFLYQLAPNNPFYNVPAAIRLVGALDQEALERSFNQIIQRHDALRTTFTVVDGEPVQVIAPHLTIKLERVNLQSVTVQDRERIRQQFAIAEAQRPFNLTVDPLLRVTLVQFDLTESILLLTLHHIVADGWSLGVLIRELACFYTAFVEEQPPTLPALPIQYADFACWQRRELQGEVLARQLSYWRSQLQNLTMLQLPSDRSRPSVQSYRGATYPLQLSPTLTQALETLSQQSGSSLFMTLLAAFQTLLYRYTGQEDIAIGSPIANRHRSELEGLIGFFVNSLVMRSDLSGNPTFRELLKRVREVAIGAYAHQDLPFEKLVEELDPERDLSRNPLFQVAFALQNAPIQALELPELTLEPAPLTSNSTRFDLEVHLWEPSNGLRSIWQSQEGLNGFVAYSTDLFDRDRIARLVGHFQTLLEGIVHNPDARLLELPLLTAAEQQQMVEWNQTDSTCTPDLCFHQIFEAQVQADPTAIAIVAEATLTYEELNQRADQLAQILQQMGVQPDDLIGLCVDRSLNLGIGILGILKAGAAYVPLDPNYPPDRLRFMLTDTQVSIVLTQSGLIEKLPRSQAQIICLDQLDFSSNVTPQVRKTVTPDHLAYVIYTSGSTGIPKGVLLTHHGLCNVVEAQRQVFPLSRDSKILQLSALSFDASVFEIALAFGSGSTLYIPPQSAQFPGMALMQFLQDHAITHALLMPAVLAVLPEVDLPALEVLITGGEACSSQVLDRWATNRRFFNAYGPTETTIWATVAELDRSSHPLMIGRAIANTQVYILDAALNPVPVGIGGELYIGGEGLARGYLNRPELTAERFICTEHSILYKTGDRACYHADGTIEFLGRIDTQIKIRGFRVELGEIETMLQHHSAVQDAVVIPANQSLIAYFSLDRSSLQHSKFQTQQIQHWKTLYDQTYHAADHNQPFNITGWNSSYTGEPIAIEQMQEWISDRVDQILALNPQRVLEIGCGTGLLLFEIAPHCKEYVGTDFSTASIASIQPQLEQLPQVKLLHRMATDFEDINTGAFDVVILNSIVQYFPSQDYLLQVLEGAIQTVAPGGVVFIGDVRSLPLLTAFHAWMKFSQADAGIERSQLRQSVERSHFEEPELAIAPEFFQALRGSSASRSVRFPRIQHVQIRLSRGRSQNEMTQFRYNVLLHIEASTQPQTAMVEQYNWKLQPMTIAAIQHQFCETQADILKVTNIANKRVTAAIQTVNWLFSKTAPKTVGRMREQLQHSIESASDPQDWWDLEKVLPCKVEITWSTQTDSGDYDVSLIRHGIGPKIDGSIAHLQSWHHYTNDPLQSLFARQLIPELRQFLKQTLPDYMVPSAFVPLAALPLTSSGKVDRRALSMLDADSVFVNTDTTTAPETQTERSLIEIWKELLRLKQVNRHDNFFELGGHSLLATQMTSRVRNAFGLELPLKMVFESPTIAQLAPIIDTLRETASIKQPPAIVRLDRAAHRRVRSSNSKAYSAPPESLPLDQSPQASWSPLVPLTVGTHKQPFFCIHPMFGVVLPYLELAHHLSSDAKHSQWGDRSFYGLQPLGLDGKHPPLNRIEAIAAYYIKAIQTIQPQGPYLLGGWSFGGLVAFEMAQQLTEAGQQIELLAILDTPAPSNLQPSLGQSLKFLLGTALWSTLPFLLDYGAIALHRSRLPWKSWFSRWQRGAIAQLIPEESQLRLWDES